MYLNIWSLVGGVVWRGYGTFRRCGLAGQSCHWGLALRVSQSLTLTSGLVSLPEFVFELTQLLALATCYRVSPVVTDSPSGTQGPNKLWREALSPGILSQQQGSREYKIICSKWRDRVCGWESRRRNSGGEGLAWEFQTEWRDGEETLPRLHISLKGNLEIPPENPSLLMHNSIRTKQDLKGGKTDLCCSKTKDVQISDLN